MQSLTTLTAHISSPTTLSPHIPSPTNLSPHIPSPTTLSSHIHCRLRAFLAASFWVMNEATNIASTTLAISQCSKSSFSTSNIFEG
ncbi:hypothetical protein DPMN_125824 [Dreissena polymorpha]|uniref:Uncharacterized protein n=1 Tax=Dreissena polymorpha TaxID=45954 RepID=A0A9D4GUL8_DREPO|nr:hypothetical protein DPMN_125824 [Dreissena polymorpha]